MVGRSQATAAVCLFPQGRCLPFYVARTTYSHTITRYRQGRTKMMWTIDLDALPLPQRTQTRTPTIAPEFFLFG